MVNTKTQKLYEQLISGERSGDLFRDDAIASEYDKNASLVFGKDLEQYAADIDFLLDLTTYSSKDTIVDLGCGTGISTLRILERNPRRVIGLDFSEPMLRQAREKLKDVGNVEFRVASAEELSDVIKGVDKVVSANVFQYLSDPDLVLQGVYDSLNPNGEYLFNVKVKAPKEQSIYFHLFRNIERAISEELNKSKKTSPIILIDPTFKERNALSSLSKETFYKFQNECKTFLKNPSSKFFIRKNVSDEFKKHKNVKILTIKTTKQSGDIAGTKSKKFFDFIVSRIKKEFEIKKQGFYYNDKKNLATFYFVIDKKQPSIIKGPPVNSPKNLTDFKKAHPKAFIKKGFVYVKLTHNLTFNSWFQQFQKKDKKIIRDMGIKDITL